MALSNADSLQFLFPPFRFDPANACLWREGRQLRLRPKTFAVLHYLLAHADRLVTKEELLKAVWPGLHVSATLPKDSVLELRRVLGDKAQTPRFIETIYGRGYRFIAPLSTTLPFVQGSTFQVPGLRKGDEKQGLETLNVARGAHFVGRESELSQLHFWLENALNGERQLVFISGELGIGKTALVEAFLQQVKARGQMWTSVGQCVEHYGPGATYLPIFDVLNRLSRETSSDLFPYALRRYAPTWLKELPWLLDDTDRKENEPRHQRSSPQRLLREFAELTETVAAERPILLVLEDLHWSDPSTIDLLGYLARRRERARLFILGTYRPADMLTGGHPLQFLLQETQIHRQCQQLLLPFLNTGAVEVYLSERLPRLATDPRLLYDLARRVHERTEGNPLFMVMAAQSLATQRGGGGEDQPAALVEAVATLVPESIDMLIQQQAARLSEEEQRMLEAASVAGAEFSAAEAAAGLGAAVPDVERLANALAQRQQFLRFRGVSGWPDGTIAGRYRFLHILYQHVLYERIPPARRVQLHRRIGERLEAVYTPETQEIATVLAQHFVQGRDFTRAVAYLTQAATLATRRFGYQEATAHLTQALSVLLSLPETLERDQQELFLQLTLSGLLVALKGYGDPIVRETLQRAQVLSERAEDISLQASLASALGTVSMLRGEMSAARATGAQALQLARAAGSKTSLIYALFALGHALLYQGELREARSMLAQGVALPHPPHYDRYGAVLDPWLTCLSALSLTEGFLGYFDQARIRADEAVLRARQLGHPYTIGYATGVACTVRFLCREHEAAQTLAEAEIALAHEYNFSFLETLGNALLGWSFARQGRRSEGIALMQQSLAVQRELGIEYGRPIFLIFIAEPLGQESRFEEGFAALAEAEAALRRNDELLCEALVSWMKGVLRWAQGKASAKPGRTKAPREAESYEVEAETTLLHALSVARRQGAKWFELLITNTLGRLWIQQGRKAQARKLLVELSVWFTEGFDTADWQEAQALLEQIRR